MNNLKLLDIEMMLLISQFVSKFDFRRGRMMWWKAHCWVKDRPTVALPKEVEFWECSFDLPFVMACWRKDA